MLGKQFLILSTQGGIRAPDGSPIALGYHTGHWEVGLLMQEARIDQSARLKIESQRRTIIEGSEEWTILYRKYYNEEVKKLGV